MRVQRRGLDYQARGVTTMGVQQVHGTNMFQSTRPRGARRTCSTASTTRSHVSIHAPARGATWPLVQYLARKMRVSIHAPARGATVHVRGHHRRTSVSIHAPARGATVRPMCVSLTARCFNPRAREGRDHSASRTRRVSSRFNPRAREGRDSWVSIACRRSSVSIHAPARGATS